jgi:hypothetical protein
MILIDKRNFRIQSGTPGFLVGSAFVMNCGVLV